MAAIFDFTQATPLYSQLARAHLAGSVGAAAWRANAGHLEKKIQIWIPEIIKVIPSQVPAILLNGCVGPGTTMRNFLLVSLRLKESRSTAPPIWKVASTM